MKLYDNVVINYREAECDANTSDRKEKTFAPKRTANERNQIKHEAVGCSIASRPIWRVGERFIKTDGREEVKSHPAIAYYGVGCANKSTI